jgi:hypothetical protein
LKFGGVEFQLVAVLLPRHCAPSGWKIILVLIVMLILAPFDFENEDDDDDEEDCHLSLPRRTMARRSNLPSGFALAPVTISLRRVKPL